MRTSSVTCWNGTASSASRMSLSTACLRRRRTRSSAAPSPSKRSLMGSRVKATKSRS